MQKAKILQQLIKDQGYSIRAFAKKCDLPESTLYTILKNGAGKASVNTIITICKNLGIRVEDLDEMDKLEEPPITLAAHFEGDEYTEDELEEIENFANFVRSRRKKE